MFFTVVGKFDTTLQKLIPKTNSTIEFKDQFNY